VHDAVTDCLIPAPETARRLGVSRRTVDNLAQRGLLERVRVLGATRYRESDVARIVREGTPRARDAA
jgi:predicted DNA-binding transcriptional regulator AlpA